MNHSLFSLVLVIGAATAGGTALVPVCSKHKCGAVATCETKPCPVTAPVALARPAQIVTAVEAPVAVTAPARIARVPVAPVCAVTVVATPVACDPELMRARAMARARGEGSCSGDGASATATKQKSKSCCSAPAKRAQEMAYEETVARAVEAGREAAAHADELRVQAEQLAQQGQCAQESARKLCEQGSKLSAEHRAQLERELAKVSEYAQTMSANERSIAQAHAESQLAALSAMGYASSDSIREKVRAALERSRAHEDESATDDDSGDDEDNDTSADEADDDSNDQHGSSLEERVEALEKLARERGHHIDADESSKSLEERVSSLEHLMHQNGLGGLYRYKMPTMDLGDLKELKNLKGLQHLKIGDHEVLVVPRNGQPLTVNPSDKDAWKEALKLHGKADKAQKAPKAPKAKGFTWWWNKDKSDGDDDDKHDADEDSDDHDVDVPEPPDAPDMPDAPEAPAFKSPQMWMRAAPHANPEARKEIDALMRDMRAQIDSMRTEMERLREELVRASKRGAR